MRWKTKDIDDLNRAYQILEKPQFTASLVNLLGKPIEEGMKYLPSGANQVIGNATRKALENSLKLAIATLGRDSIGQSRNLIHKLSVAASGGAGGAFGLAGLSIELPISTTIMLRSIADIARSHGENFHLPETRLACIEVFALGGRTSADDASETSYFLIRAMLAKTIADAAKHLSAKGLSVVSAPPLVKLIAQVANRFSIIVTQKAAATAVPIIGAATGALINTYFIGFYQDMALGHFTIRRLERTCSPEEVRKRYEAIRNEELANKKTRA